MTYPEPRYHGVGREVSAVHNARTLPPDLAGPNDAVDYLATGATTAGQFCLFRYETGAQPGGPSPHFHRTMTSCSSS